MSRGLDRLPDRLLLDGGMGTALMARGLDIATDSSDHWNIARPEVVRQVHLDYVAAGAGGIHTNSFGANRLRMQAFGHTDVRAHNLAAARLATEAAAARVGDPALVIGNLGPTGVIPPPEGNASLVEIEYAFAEQASVLAEGGVDFLHVETLFHPKEMRAAIRGCRAGAPDLPVVASFTCTVLGDTFRTTMGFAAETMVSVVLEENADGTGFNCTLAPGDMLDLARLVRGRTRIPLFAQPNLAPASGASCYPHEFATGVIALFAVGASAVGGCCGTSPGDIEAAAEALKSGPIATAEPAARPLRA